MACQNKNEQVFQHKWSFCVAFSKGVHFSVAIIVAGKHIIVAGIIRGICCLSDWFCQKAIIVPVMKFYEQQCGAILCIWLMPEGKVVV